MANKINIKQVHKTTREKNSKQIKAQKAVSLTSCIPFKNCYQECGIIEAVLGNFSVAYEVDIKGNRQKVSIEELKNGLRDILSELSHQFSFQFFIQNSVIDVRSFLNAVEIEENKEKEVNQIIRDYNTMLANNAEIGHNNFERNVIVVLSVAAEDIDEAVNIFQSTEEEIKKLFLDHGHFKIRRQTLEERLNTFYSLLHPGIVDDFYYDNEKTVKEQLVPPSYEIKDTYIKMGDVYLRTLFVNSLPSVVSHTILTDLMATVSNGVLSISCHPMETKLGYEVATKKVKDNTETTRVMIRNTVEDRKNNRFEMHSKRKNETENEYFYEEASEVLKDAVENNDVMMMTTFLITIFANSIDELNSNTKLLSLSANKFATQIRICEDFQSDAFKSIFPVNQTLIHTARFIPSSTIAAMQPLRADNVTSNVYSFCGLNSISDNFVMINREQCRSGLISGVPHSGKSFTMKREIVNKMMTSDDNILLITQDLAPYSYLMERLGIEPNQTDHVDFYGLGLDERMRRLMFNAFMVNDAKLHTKKISSISKKNYISNIKEEAEQLAKFKTWNEAIQDINTNRQKYPNFMTALKKYVSNNGGIKRKAGYFSNQKKINVVQVKNDSDLVIALTTALAYIREREATGEKVALYVDWIDGLFYSSAGSDYIISIVNAILGTSSNFTMVVQDAVRILTNQDAEIEFKFFLEKIDYCKLMRQGPIERRYYVEKLNIPNSLVQYITDREPGEGIIITPSENVAFNDRFENSEDPFYSIFFK